MRVVFWDTRKQQVNKYENDGFGAIDSAWPGRMLKFPWRRSARPVSLLYGYLAAIFHRNSCQVRYVTDRIPPEADIFVFNPVPATVHTELQMIKKVARQYPTAQILVVGRIASSVPQLFAELGVTVIKGDSEQLLWTLNDVLNRPRAIVNLGVMEDLNHLSPCDWEPFSPWKFRVKDECWQFPTALIEHGRGCPTQCPACAWNSPTSEVRFRDAKRVADEIQHQINIWGFYSFKFCDPCFGHEPHETYDLISELDQIWQPLQFSVRSRVEVMTPPLLRALRQVGLRSVTIDLDTPQIAVTRIDAPTGSISNGTPDNLFDSTEPDSTETERRQIDFLELCRKLGLRTTAIFSIDPQNITQSSKTKRPLDEVLERAIRLNPTFARFRFITPWPGTPLFEQNQSMIDDYQFGRYTTLSPVLPITAGLSVKQLERELQYCSRSYHLRREHFAQHGSLVWPNLALWAMTDTDAEQQASAQQASSHSLKQGEYVEIDNNRFIRHDGPHDQASTADPANEHHDAG